jgi:hypothetical protein
MRRSLTTTAAMLVAFTLGAFAATWFSSRSVADLHSSNSEGIGIPALVDQIRDELIASDLQRTARNAPGLFVARSVDLEISFVVKRALEVGSKVALEVVDADTKLMIGTERTHTMTIHLDVQQPVSFSTPPSKD